MQCFGCLEPWTRAEPILCLLESINCHPLCPLGPPPTKHWDSLAFHRDGSKYSKMKIFNWVSGHNLKICWLPNIKTKVIYLIMKNSKYWNKIQIRLERTMVLFIARSLCRSLPSPHHTHTHTHTSCKKKNWMWKIILEALQKNFRFTSTKKCFNSTKKNMLKHAGCRMYKFNFYTLWSNWLIYL